ncbi:uncharacterized protein znf142 [Menidia menidia]
MEDESGPRLSDCTTLASHRCSKRQSVSAEKGQVDGYKCSQCSDVYSKPAALRHHFKTNHRDLEPKGPFSCSEHSCQFSSIERQQYQAHLASVHGLRLVTCTYQPCKVSFHTRGEMESHRRGHMPFGCFHCPFVTQNAKDLNAHLSEHNHQPNNCQGKASTLGTKGGHLTQISSGKTRKPKSTPILPKDRLEEEPGKHGDDPTHRRKAVEEETSSAVDAGPVPSKEYLAEGSEATFRTHTCPKCRRCFKMRSHLQEHLRLHFPDPGLQCPTCQRFFTSKSKLRIHRLREAGDKTHRCPLCEYSAVERNAVRRHLLSVHPDQAEEGAHAQAYLCPACGQSFHQSRALKAHMKTHNVLLDSKPLACFLETCSFQSGQRKELLRHASEAHGLQAAACRHHACGAVFRSRPDMEAHYRTHLTYHCSECAFSCSNKALFLQHRRHGHPGERKLRCGFCPFATFNPVEFEQHTGHLHANEKTHRCPQCSYVTAHKRGLKRHLLLHSGEKPHKCTLCDFRCRDESYLSRHMLTHSDDKNFMCTECGYVTKWKHYLNVHMRKHAGDLRYSCDQCPYRCHRMDQLSSHKLRHQAKSLMCEICAYSCKRKYELRNHMLAKHSEEGRQPAPFKCKYCPYSTCFRQALRNHENCKHTRLKEFPCALCPYSSFSSVSLFLHKKKAHGYVPGDKAWLENYAAKERERSSNQLGQDFYSGPAGSGQRSEPAGGIPAEPKASVDSPEQFCTLVLTALTSTDERSPPAPGEGEGGGTASTLRADGPDWTREKEGDSAQESSSDEDNAAARDREGGQSHVDESREPLSARGQRSEEENGGDTKGHESPPGQGRTLQSETHLKAMKKHDRDQAEAMVLEGRVQVLVLPTGGGFHREQKRSRHTEAALRPRTRGPERRLREKHGRGTQGSGDGEASDGEPAEIQRPEPGPCTSGTSASERQKSKTQGGKQPSAGRHRKAPLQIKGLYAKKGGKFKCKLCGFSSVELPVIKRHLPACRCSISGKKQQAVPKTDVDSSKGSSNSGGGLAEKKYSDKPELFACPDCPFKRGQTRTSESPLKRGCVKPGGEQCGRCSSVAEKKKLNYPKAGRLRCKRAHRLPASGGAAPKAPQQNGHPQVQCQESNCPKEASEVEPQRAHRYQLGPSAAQTKQALDQHVLDQEEGGSPEGDSLEEGPLEEGSPGKGFPEGGHQPVREPHLRSLGSRRLYKCADCQYSTRNKQKMTWHVRIHTGEKPYRCEQCAYACTDPSRLKLHMRVHQEEKKYLCPECGYKCKWATQLKYHMTKHTGEKPYACEECDYRTNRADALRVHRATQHCETRPYVCEECGKAFKTSFILKTHQRQHRAGRPYACGLCQKAFRWPAGLRHHFLSHTMQQPFGCRHCPYRAKQKFQVVKHLQKHHPQVPVEQGVLRDSATGSLTLKEALQGTLDEKAPPGTTSGRLLGAETGQNKAETR